MLKHNMETQKLWELYKKYIKEGIDAANHKGENRVEMFLIWLEKQ